MTSAVKMETVRWYHLPDYAPEDRQRGVYDGIKSVFCMEGWGTWWRSCLKTVLQARRWQV